MGNADKRVVTRAEHFYTTQDLLVKTVSHCDVFFGLHWLFSTHPTVSFTELLFFCLV